ncbi:popeye domain-containing protein 3 [Lepeophtheirus salmonis]|uniref:popeye domain-containing protein 3 n=1 Tax=Lepeophtheirus salmonis TaxID=72036 RepID=UPI001AE495DD|nr:popeye domain-containing protein 3-like [Lepeophtheirus salmonis]
MSSFVGGEEKGILELLRPWLLDENVCNRRSIYSPGLSAGDKDNSSLEEDPYTAAQDLLFHFSYGLFALSYLSPNSRYGRLLLHAGLVAGFLVCSSWAWNVLCAPEIFGWNFSFILLNIGQLLYILYQMRPIKFPEEIENLYLSLFAPLRVPRTSFEKLISLDIVEISELHSGECYAIKDLSKTVRLAVLLQGRVHVVNENNYLHDIRPNEFLDSPEYESSGINCEETFKVTVLAAVPSKILVWQRSSLEYLFIKDPYLGSVMTALISQDITNKIYSMNKKLKNAKGSSLDIRLPGIAGRLSKLNDKELSELVELNRKRDKSDEKAKKSFVKSFRRKLKS